MFRIKVVHDSIPKCRLPTRYNAKWSKRNKKEIKNKSEFVYNTMARIARCVQCIHSLFIRIVVYRSIYADWNYLRRRIYTHIRNGRIWKMVDDLLIYSRVRRHVSSCSHPFLENFPFARSFVRSSFRDPPSISFILHWRARETRWWHSHVRNARSANFLLLLLCPSLRNARRSRYWPLYRIGLW